MALILLYLNGGRIFVFLFNNAQKNEKKNDRVWSSTKLQPRPFSEKKVKNQEGALILRSSVTIFYSNSHLSPIIISAAKIFAKNFAL